MDAHKKALLSQVTIRIHLCAFDTFEILALNERLDSLLDHVNFWLELLSQLAKSFRDELLM
jgi:hypothetical protein